MNIYPFSIVSSLYNIYDMMIVDDDLDNELLADAILEDPFSQINE